MSTINSELIKLNNFKLSLINEYFRISQPFEGTGGCLKEKQTEYGITKR